MATDEEKLFQKLKKQHKAAEQCKSQLKRRWRIAEAFLASEHNVAWDQLNSDLTRIEHSPDWKPRLTINKCLMYYRREKGRLESAWPQFECAPGSREYQDLVSAEKCTKLIKYWERALPLRRANGERIASELAYGKGFLKPKWNPMGRDEQGRQVGEIEVEALSPWEVSVWPNIAKSATSVRTWFHQTQKPYEWLEDNFPDKADKIKPGQGGQDKRGLTSSLKRVFQGRAAGDEAGTDKPITVVEAWVEPCRKHPQGLWLIWCSDQILHGPAPIPYKHNQVPIIDFTYTGMPGVFWGIDFIYPLTLLNAAYNRSRSQMMELMNIVGKGDTTLLPSGCGISAEDLTDDPGQILEFDPLTDPRSDRPIMPQKLYTPTVPAGVFTYVQELGLEMDKMASQREVSQGSMPPNVESGIGIQALQEADTLPLTPTVLDGEEGWRRVFQQMLSLAQQFYQEPRLLRFFGRGSELDIVQSFSGRDIRPNIDVIVRSGSGTPQSKSAQRKDVMDMVAVGIVQPGEARAMLEFQDLYPEDDDHKRDLACANEENSAMVRGMPKLVHDYDNHQVHMLQHNRFRKAPIFDQIDPRVQQIFQMHVAGHQQVIDMLMRQQMAMQAQMQQGQKQGAVA